MDLILDVAAGVLLAAAIICIVLVGIAAMMDNQREGGNGRRGLIISVVGVLIWLAFIALRLLRWP